MFGFLQDYDLLFSESFENYYVSISKISDQKQLTKPFSHTILTFPFYHFHAASGQNLFFCHRRLISSTLLSSHPICLFGNGQFISPDTHLTGKRKSEEKPRRQLFFSPSQAYESIDVFQNATFVLLWESIFATFGFLQFSERRHLSPQQCLLLDLSLLFARKRERKKFLATKRTFLLQLSADVNMKDGKMRIKPVKMN